jgi:uncharacterized membrane protein
MSSQPKSVRSLLHSVRLSKGRMEALTDGIFAIAMTLLVLELKAPDLPKNIASSQLLEHLSQLMPAFFGFLVSFLYCGMLWFLHHMALHFIRHLQAGLVWLNLFFLMSISLMPFSCALLGRFIRNVAAREIYFGNLFLASVLLALQWWFAKRKDLINQDDPLAALAMGQQLIIFPAAIGAALLVTPFHPLAGFYAMIFALLALRIWQRQWLRKATKTLAPLQPVS